MKIAMLTSLFLPSIGGVEAHIYNISKSLQEYGHSVIVLHTIMSNENQTGVVKASVDGLVVYRIYVHTRVEVFSGLRSLSYVYGFLRKVQPVSHTLTIYRLVKQVCEQENIEIIHQHDFISNIFTTKLLSRKWPIVLTNHTGEYLLLMRHWTTRRVLAFFLKHFSYMIGPSKELCDVSYMSRPIPVQYIANGVDPALFREVTENDKMQLRREYNLPEDRQIVLCARRWAPTKGVVYLVQAIPYVLQVLPHTLFVISGNDYTGYPEYAASINDYIREHHLEAAIKLVGDIPHTQMEHYDQMSDVVTLPSLLEATSLSGLEAMSCGKPLVATNIGGIPEIVEDGKNGILVPARDARALAKAIIILLQDKKLCKQMGKYARWRIENEFAWAVCSKKVAQIYAKVMKS